VCVHADVAATAAPIPDLLKDAAAELGLGTVATDQIELTDEFLGPGYGISTPEMVEAIALFARTEGLLLDPVYSGKAGAALVSLVRRGELRPDERVLFLHTGGAPALFAYGREVIART
jgi:1-aminocyclopropane-1-carboxylate deaminase/D-cysteine desulfhydrase-like pyridoxal-dependent ACC family enzyme